MQPRYECKLLCTTNKQKEKESREKKNCGLLEVEQKQTIIYLFECGSWCVRDQSEMLKPMLSTFA